MKGWEMMYLSGIQSDWIVMAKRDLKRYACIGANDNSEWKARLLVHIFLPGKWTKKKKFQKWFLTEFGWEYICSGKSVEDQMRSGYQQ